MGKLLLEVLTEEIPYSLQRVAEEDAKALLEQAFSKAQIGYSNVEVKSTPRRLVVVAYGVDEAVKDVIEEKKGPKVAANKEAIEGFLKTNGVTLKDLSVKNTDKGDFYFLNIIKKGGDIRLVLPQIIEKEVLEKIKFKKSMKYNKSAVQWARPIRKILAIFEDKIGKVDFLNIAFAGVQSGMLTDTHRFFGSNNVQVASIDDYFQKLKEGFVILGADERKNIILEKSVEISNSYGLSIYNNDELINEVAYLVEYVSVLLGEIPKKYMVLPDELLVNIIAKNQRYINLVNQDGSLSEKFIIVSNNVPIDSGKEIILGNKKVLEARLEDGLFFYNNDLKINLLDRVEELKKVNFFEGLGSLYDKKERIKELFKRVFHEEQSLLCDLCKVDITTSVVFEIPDLQGIMGGYYALKQEYSKDIAIAISDHYKPRSANDSIPSSVLGAKLAMLDKLDTLIALFSIGKKPTGSKDPFALRRATIGIIKIILEYEFDINFKDFLQEDVIEFLKERIIFYYKDKGYSINIINSVVMQNAKCNILEINKNILFFEDIIKQDVGQDLLQLFKRITNILMGVDLSMVAAPNIDLAVEDIEKDLIKEIKTVEEKVQKLLQTNNIKDALKEAVSLKPFLDSFLDNVLINKSANDSLKRNRLSLLVKILNLLDSIFPFKDVSI